MSKLVEQVDRYVATIMYLIVLLILLTIGEWQPGISKIVLYLGIIISIRHFMKLVSDDLMIIKNRKKGKNVIGEPIGLRSTKYISTFIITIGIVAGFLYIYSNVTFLYTNNKLEFERYADKVVDINKDFKSSDSKVIVHLKRVAYKGSSIKVHGYIENFTNNLLILDENNFYIKLNNQQAIGIDGGYNKEFNKSIQPGKSSELILKFNNKKLHNNIPFEINGLLTNKDSKPFEGEKINFKIE